MAKIKWIQTFRNTSGATVGNAPVSIYLAGTGTAARVFDDDDNLIEDTPQQKTDGNGRTVIYLDPDDFSTGQLFDVVCSPDPLCGVESDEIRFNSLMILRDTEGFRNFKNIFAQDTIPSEGMQEGDLWIETDDNNEMHVYEDGNWISRRDGMIANAQDTADSKRRTFTTTPTTPYDVGDLWVAGSTGDIKKCKIARATGAYHAGDWDLASKYDKTADSPQPANWLSDLIDTLHLASDAVTAAKLAVAGIDGTTGNVAANHIVANMLQTNCVTAAKIQADAVTATKINVADLAAINADVGTITAGILRSSDWAASAGMALSLDSKYLKMGGWNVTHAGAAAGIYLGLHSGSYKFYIGDGSFQHLKYDGGNVSVSGKITCKTDSRYLGDSISESYTAADITSTHTANNTTYINGSTNQNAAGNEVDIYKDLRMQDGVDISFYYSSTHKGGIYGSAGGLIILGKNSNLTLNSDGHLYLQSTGDVIIDSPIYPSSNGSGSVGTASYHFGSAYINRFYRNYSTSGRLKIYNKTSGALIEEYRYAFT